MPTLTVLGNIDLVVYFNDTQKHKRPHFHALGPDRDAVLGIPELDVIEGSLRSKEIRDVQQWAANDLDRLIMEWNRCNPQMPIGRKAED